MSLVLTTCFMYMGISAQIDMSSSRYMQTQYFINPAYVGTSNTMAANLMARKQWAGMDGAPTSYRFSAHSPINNSFMSVGGGVSLEHFGVNKVFGANLSYAYLLKISPVTFVSLGISANASSHQINFNELAVTDSQDPFFSGASEGGTNINANTGIFLYSRKFYLGLSVLNMLGIDKLSSHSELNELLEKKHFYLATGYTFHPSSSIGVKPSFLLRYNNQDFYNLSSGLQVMYKELFWIGGTYSQDGWVSNVFNLQIKKNIGVAYTFDYTVGANAIQRNNHEISLAYNINGFYKANKKREFGLRKGKKDKTKQGMKSMRYF